MESTATREIRRWWHTPGLTARQETLFHRIAMVLVVVMLSGWVMSIVEVQQNRAAFAAAGAQEGERHAVSLPSVNVSKKITSALLDPEKKTTPYISDAAVEFLNPLRGESGKLNVAFRTPGQQVSSDPGEIGALYTSESGTTTSPDFRAPDKPGVYKLAVQLQQATKPVRDLSVITLVPFSEKRKGRIGTYMLGSWPYESGGTPRNARYANPSGFVEVTAQNRDTYVSKHFRLRDFLTKDQSNVWPKYLLIDPLLIDKLELVIAELEAEGVKVEHVHIMSGFRTPRYNHTGGNTSGRASTSRHMYGDAADFYVDNNRDGYPDDVTGDGRVTVKDAEFTAAMAERVERKHPSLVGGVGIYVACCGHGPFTHVDVRGYRARWRGTGKG